MCMGLDKILDIVSDLKDKAGDKLHSTKAKRYYDQGEIYRTIGEAKIYEVFRKRCREEYSKISDPAVKKEVKDYIAKYLQRKP